MKYSDKVKRRFVDSYKDLFRSSFIIIILVILGYLIFQSTYYIDMYLQNAALVLIAGILGFLIACLSGIAFLIIFLTHFLYIFFGFEEYVSNTDQSNKSVLEELYSKGMTRSQITVYLLKGLFASIVFFIIGFGLTYFSYKVFTTAGSGAFIVAGGPLLIGASGILFYGFLIPIHLLKKK